MIKSFYFLILLIIIPALSNSQVIEYHTSILSLRGPVLSVRTTAYEPVEENGVIRKGELAKSGMSVDGLYTMNSYHKFNKQGYVILSENYLVEKLRERRVYNWDSSNNIINYKTYGFDYDSNFVLKEEDFFRYNLNNNLVEKINVQIPDSIVTKTIFRYDNHNNCIEEIVYSNSNSNHTYPDLDIVTKIIRKYDSDGNMIKKKFYNSYFKISKEVLRYNRQGQLIKKRRKFFRRKGAKSTMRYSYNEKGQLKETTVHDKGRDKWKKDQYEYDEFGNITLHISNSFKNEEKTLTYKYDSFGNKTYKSYSSDKHDINAIKESIYEYDTKKNWTKRIDFINGKATLIIEREFTYY